MKIGIDAYVLEPTRTGVARYLINMLKYWAENHNDYQYILYFKDRIPDDKILEQDCFQKKLIKASSLLKRGIIWQLFTIGREAKKDDVDIFLSPRYFLPLVKMKAKKLIGMWDIYFYVHSKYGSFTTKIYNRLFSRWTAQHSDIILTCSEYDKSEIVTHLQVKQDKVNVTYLAAEEKFKPLNNKKRLDEFRKKYNFKTNYFLYVGLIINRRFQDTVIHAFQEFLKKNPNDEWGLVIVGPNRTAPFIDIKKLINQYNPKKAISYIEFFPEEDMVELYNAAYASIYLSLTEGEGIPLKEAMACGTPVITTHTLKEIIGEKDPAGCFIRYPDQKHELVQMFDSFYSYKNKRNLLAQKALKRVKKFTWKKCADETMAVIKSLFKK